MRWLRRLGVALEMMAVIGLGIVWGSSRNSRFGWTAYSYSATSGMLTTRHACVEGGRFILSEGTLASRSAIDPSRQIRWQKRRAVSSSGKWPLLGRSEYDTYAVLGFEANRADSGWHVAVPCWAVFVMAAAVTVWPIRRHWKMHDERGFSILSRRRTVP